MTFIRSELTQEMQIIKSYQKPGNKQLNLKADARIALEDEELANKKFWAMCMANRKKQYGYTYKKIKKDEDETCNTKTYRR